MRVLYLVVVVVAIIIYIYVYDSHIKTCNQIYPKTLVFFILYNRFIINAYAQTLQYVSHSIGGASIPGPIIFPDDDGIKVATKSFVTDSNC
jgi:hypothetical protein